MLVYVAVCGFVYMQQSLLVFHGKAHCHTKTFIYGIERGIGLYYAVNFGDEYFLYKSGDVVVVIVKSVARHAAGVGNVLNGDFA